MAIRVATWNVYHGTIGTSGSTPQARMTEFTAFCKTKDVHIIAFQEVPATVLAAGMTATLGTTGYLSLTVSTEYPPTPLNPAPASATADGYVVLYDSAVVTPTGGLDFFVPVNFRPGVVSQSRPPVACQFSKVGAPTSTCQFSTWHNEAGSIATNGIVGLHNTYIKLTEAQIIVGDFNVPTQTGLTAPFFPRWTAVTDGLDAVLSNVNVTNVSLASPPAPFLSDSHFAIVADVSW